MAKHVRRLGIRISDDLLARLRNRAATEDRTVGAIVRRILNDALL